MDLPAEEVPAELPEPCLGINFARNGMQKRDWLALVAVHSDAWLLSVAFYYGARLDAAGRSKWVLAYVMPCIRFTAKTTSQSDMVSAHGPMPEPMSVLRRLFKTINSGPTLFEIVMGQGRSGGGGTKPRNRKEAVSPSSCSLTSCWK